MIFERDQPQVENGDSRLCLLTKNAVKEKVENLETCADVIIERPLR